MASPPTPEPWTDAELRSWGPTEPTRRLRVHRVIDLVVARRGLAVDEVADMLLATPGRRYLLLERLGQTRHSTVYGSVEHRRLHMRSDVASTAALLACTFAILGAGGHALYSAYVAPEFASKSLHSSESLHSSGPLHSPEPATDAVSQAIELARNDDPFGVWAIYVQMRDSQKFNPKELIVVATILMLDAESGAASDPAASAEIGRRLGNQAQLLAAITGDYAQVWMARELVER